MCIQVYKKILLISCAALSFSGSTSGLHISLTNTPGSITYGNTNSDVEFERMQNTLRIANANLAADGLPVLKYTTLQDLFKTLPWSNKGALIDTNHLLGCWHHQGQAPLQSPELLGIINDIPIGLFKPRNYFREYIDRDIVLIDSAQPVMKPIESFREVPRLAKPMNRYRGTNLRGKELYFLSGVMDTANGQPLENYRGKYLVFAPCMLAEGQDITRQKKVYLNINDWTGDSDATAFKLKISCPISHPNSGGPILIRVKDTGPAEEQFQLVGFASQMAPSPPNDKTIVATICCPKQINSWIDNEIIKDACQILPH